MQEIASQIAAIRADTEHGATFLTQEALTVLKDAAAVIPGDTSWEDSLTWVGKTLTGWERRLQKPSRPWLALPMQPTASFKSF